MLFDHKHEKLFDRLEGELRGAQAVTPELMSSVMAESCVRLFALGATSKTKLGRLIESGAWVDAALALLEFELPQWKLRRIVYEDGEWLCSLSKQPQLPLELDDVAEANHQSLPLAILMAFLRARSAGAVDTAGAVAVPKLYSEPGYPVCCENFT
jgi:hypothetical protein